MLFLNNLAKSPSSFLRAHTEKDCILVWCTKGGYYFTPFISKPFLMLPRICQSFGSLLVIGFFGFYMKTYISLISYVLFLCLFLDLPSLSYFMNLSFGSALYLGKECSSE